MVLFDIPPAPLDVLFLFFCMGLSLKGEFGAALWFWSGAFGFRDVFFRYVILGLTQNLSLGI